MIRSLKIFIASFPVKIIVWKLSCKLFGLKIPQKQHWFNFFTNKGGIEIGGPSSSFKSTGYLPIYPVIAKLDGVNFSESTVWEGIISQGDFYKYENKIGFQYIAEGTNMPDIEENKYDFVLSCNNLEHIANPINAVLEWKRIIKTGGNVLLILPNKFANFDHKRPDSTIEHLIDDYNKKTTEEDTTHIEEILNLHDLKRDSQAGSKVVFKKRCMNNFNNRCLHHHVYNQNLLKQLIEFCDMEVKLQYTSLSDHYIIGVKR